MKSFLVLVGGGDRDKVIIRTAYAAAAPLGARLELLHIHVSAPNAMMHDEHAQFVMGAGIHTALNDFDARARTYSRLASDHALAFVRSLDEHRQSGGKPVTATYGEEHDFSLDRLVAEAEKRDLVVMGRARQTQGLAPSTVEHLLRKCGQPILIPAQKPSNDVITTVMICWDGSDNVRRTMNASDALLARAKKLVFVNVGGLPPAAIRERNELVERFAKRGISIELKEIEPGNSVPDALAAAANQLDANLVVMGAYGRWRVRELLMGSCTENILHCMDRPILLMH
jgi:nucleotide-binding universal stress UspA family protein